MTNRTRTFVNRIDPTGSFTRYQGIIVNGQFTGTYQIVSSGSLTGGKETDVMTDVVTPDYRRRIAKGELIINPGSRTKRFVAAYPGQLTQAKASVNDYIKIDADYMLPCLVQYGAVPATDVSYLPTDIGVDTAKLRSIAAINRPDHSLMEDVLTMKQNIEMMKGPLQGLDRTLETMLKEKRSLLRVGKAVGDLWLKYRFAATPFVYSLTELMEAAIMTSDTLRAGVRLRSRGSYRTESLVDNTQTLGTVTTRTTARKELRVAATCYWRVKHDVPTNFSKKLGIRLQDVPAGLWAAMPYSFMIDRAVNVTNMLDALVNMGDPNLVIEGGCVTTVCRTVTNQACTISTPGYSESLTGATMDWVYEDITRSPWSPSVVDCRPPLDLLNLVSTSTKVLDLAFLVLQKARLANTHSST